MKEKDIRPQEIYEKYIQLSLEDATSCFGDEVRHDISCVACGSDNKKEAFKKLGFSYMECNSCGSLFLSPRPSIESFEAFYRDSKSSNYWAEVFFPATLEQRRKSIFKPRVKRLSDMVKDIGSKANSIIDVGAGYGIFLDEWKKINPQSELIAIEPSAAMASACRKQGFKTDENIVEDVKDFNEYADLVVCFEVLEHVYDPISFIGHLKRLAKPGGLVFISTLCIDGFDLQMLWDKSSQISPPHHINFLSVKGFKKLFENAGIENISVTTPGKLDVDIVMNASKKDIDILNNNRFLNNLIKNSENASAFQNFLSTNALSSHAWIIGRVPEQV